MLFMLVTKASAGQKHTTAVLKKKSCTAVGATWIYDKELDSAALGGENPEYYTVLL